MSMLSRYQKSQGFIQLLKLIETSAAQKQEKFLQMIEQEDARWAVAIKRRMLSISRILAWDPKYIAELAVRVQELTLGVALHGFEAKDRERILATFTHAQKRRIDEHFSTKNPSQAEIAAAYMKIIEEARNMLVQGYLRADQIDPTLVIEENIEEKLASSFNPEVNRSSTPAATEETPVPDMSALEAAASSDANHIEVAALKKQIVTLTKENTALRLELKKLEEKINQIKRIA